MATNTAALKTFAQQTRLKLLSLIKTKLEFILTQDTAELRGYETQIANLKTQIQAKGKDIVVEEVAYTWFNRVMALRYMDANDYSTPKWLRPLWDRCVLRFCRKPWAVVWMRIFASALRI